MKDATKDWQLYEAGKTWNNQLEPPFYELVKTNWEMFNGNQWLYSGAKQDLPKPVVNLINRVISFFVASLTSTAVSVNFAEMAKLTPEDDNEQDMMVLKNSFDNFSERIGLQDRVRETYLDGAVTGDMAWHLFLNADKLPYDGKYSDVIGEIDFEIVDGNNVYFGNPNIRDIEKQPYVIIFGRDTVKNLQAEYDSRKNEKYTISSDSEVTEQAGYAGDIEIEDTDETGKAGYVLKYFKKNGVVHVSKSIKDRYIFENVNLGYKYYPVVWGNWEKQKNNYHGRALCTSIIPNQIFINQMFAMIMVHLQLTAFPKVIYNTDVISGWTNQLGSSIGASMREAEPGTNVTNVAHYMQPGNMSNQIAQIIDMIKRYTLEMLGANDALLGSVNPEAASGVAITIAAKQSGVPLENPRAHMYEMLDKLGKVYVDMVSNDYGERPVVLDDNGEKMVGLYNFDGLKSLYTNVKVDVGSTSYYNEIAVQQTIDNWVANGWIDFVEYLEMLPDTFVKGKEDLINKRKENAGGMANELQAMQQPAIGV